MKRILFIAFLMLNSLGYSQESNPFEQAKNLEGEEFIDFVKDNCYPLYSLDFDSALFLTKKAKELAIKNKLSEKQAYLSVNYGVINYLRGNYEEAIKSYLEALDLFDSLDNPRGLAKTYNELAVYYHKNDQFEKAIEALDKSQKYATEINAVESLGTSLSHRASFLSRKGKYEEAYPIFLRVLEIRRQQNDSIGLGYVYLDIAEYHLHKGNLEKSIEWVQKSTEIRKAINDLQGVAVNTVIIGENYFHIGDYKKAIPYFKETIGLASKIGYTDLIRFSYDMLQQSFLKLKDYKNAYESLAKNRIFNDSIFNVERSKALLELQTQFETQKKEQQIALQEAEIAEQEAELVQGRILLIGSTVALILLIAIGFLWRNRIKKKQQIAIQEEKLKTKEAEINASINSQEKERARYARDLHDGFGQMISILNMNLRSLKKDAKPGDRQKVFEESEKVIDEMYSELKSICFDLMPQTLVKNGLKSGLSEFAERINKSGKIFVETSFFDLDERLDELQEISLYRISQEWINNILKYSDADKITLQITKDEQEITLMIEDNGHGFDKSILINGKGNGWKNLNLRASLIHGELELETQQGLKGNVLIVNAPASIPKTKENTVEVV